jgi:hypothetical protein
MIYFKQPLGFSICVILSLLLNCACNNSESHPDTSTQTKESPNKTDLKVGGFYLTRNEDGSYSVSKVLATDDFAVHLRIYGNKFKAKPTQLNSSDLDILIGHSPLDKQGFLSENPELLKVEDVKESELEGYKLYLEEMKKNN